MINLENANSIILDGYRAIGLKETDMNRLAQASHESSFTTPVNETRVEDSPVVTASGVEASVMPETASVMSTGGPEVVAANQPVVPEVNSNIFDQPVVEPVSPVMPETPASQDVVSTVNVFDAPIANDDVQGGTQLQNPSTLDTPQTFFAREEQAPVVESAPVNAQVGDPVIIMMNEVTDAYNRQKATIEELSQKVIMLEEQLRVSEEARKVADAQRIAAEQTLAGARLAENDGPSLVYQQNYNQAA